MNPILSRRATNDGFSLSLRFPGSAVKGGGRALSAAMAEMGRLVRDGVSRPWRFESIDQDGEGAMLSGPDPFGPEPTASPVSLDDPAELAGAFARLFSAARAFAVLEREGLLPRGVVSPSLLFSADGGTMLLLPPTAVAKALGASAEEARSTAAARLASPRSPGAVADASFLLAQAAYRFATGRHAFEREAVERGSLAGAAPSGASALLAAPNLDRALASLVDRALADPASAPLAEWLSVLGSAEKAGWTREVGAEEAAELEKRLEAARSQAGARRRRADFLRKRGAILLGAAIAAVALALVAADILRAQRNKPNFSALSSSQLVERYYKAIDDLDLDSLEACGEKSAIQQDDSMLANFVVVTRTRMAYEGKNPLLPARKWLAAGRPPLEPSDFLFGIAGLSLAEEDGGAPDRAVFRADYSLWYLDKPDSAPLGAAAVATESRRSDTLTLARGKKGWRIVGLERRELP